MIHDGGNRLLGRGPFGQRLLVDFELTVGAGSMRENSADVFHLFDATQSHGIIVDQGWAKVFAVSSAGYVGLVDGERGLHQSTDEKSVTVSFFTDDVEGWFDYMHQVEGLEFRTEELSEESGRVSTFVGYDPEGYFLEWDTFLDVEGNEELLELLAGR